MEEQTPRPVRNLLRNREALKLFLGVDYTHYTPPSSCEHYVHEYLHDKAYAAYVYARYGYTREAVTESFSVLNHQDERGFVPNQIFAEKGRRYDLERMFFNNPNEHSDYSQPPIMALSTLETHNALLRNGQENEAELFLKEIFPRLDRAYAYFRNYRSHSGTVPLRFNTHPHETGSDSEPITDFSRFRLQRRGPDTPKIINEINRATDYLSTALVLNGMMSALGWKEERIRHLFEFYSPMFNPIIVDNELIMAELAERLQLDDKAAEYRESATALESEVLDRMWFPDDALGYGLFRGLTGRSLKPVKKVGVSNLYPLLLPNLSEQQLESLLNIYELCYKTAYPVASAPPIDPNTMLPNRDFDPGNNERDRLGRGSSWMHHNFQLQRGFNLHASRPDLSHRSDLTGRAREHALDIARSSKGMVEDGYYEFNNSLTGEPQRAYRVWNFSWSTLADVM